MVYEAHENHYDYDENADIEERHYERTHKKHKRGQKKKQRGKRDSGEMEGIKYVWRYV